MSYVHDFFEAIDYELDLVKAYSPALSLSTS